MLEATTRGAAAELPIEGELRDLGGATAWLNSEPLTPAGVSCVPRGRPRRMSIGARYAAFAATC
jgi:hypothetical protein